MVNSPDFTYMHSLPNRTLLAGLRRQACDDVVRSATADQRVNAEAAAGGIDRELHMHNRKKHIVPRPFSGMAVEAKPEVQRVGCRNNRDEAHADAKHQRHRESKLSQEHERIDDIDKRQIYTLHELAMKRERRMFAHLPGPILETAGDR